MSTYVVGIDGSDTAAKAAARAAELAKATGATVHVVCAFADSRRGTVTVGSDEFDVSGANTAEQIANQQAAAFRTMGISSTYASVEGKPANVLLSEAERLDAEIIVVGNRRMQGVSRVLGAVANEVAHRAPCDVLVVKTV